MRRRRGSVLVLVLVVLAILGVLGAALSHSASARWLAATEYREGLHGCPDAVPRWQGAAAACDHRRWRGERVADD
jgi:hypothetical protein